MVPIFIAEYTVITAPGSFGDADVFQHVIQMAAGEGLEGAMDPGTQVLMLQPITVATVNGEQHILQEQQITQVNTGLILGLRPANERRRYKVTPSLIGWAQT